MELRAFATGLIEATSLAGKLQLPPAQLEDREPGPAVRITAPGRPPGLDIRPVQEARVPSIAGMRDRRQRARILHALANHELQAAELLAWAILAFPGAPPAFRRGLVGIARDEQRHLALYLERLRAHGHEFGDFPVTGHFWNRLQDVHTPLAFVSFLGLTLENANLDFALEYAAAARAAGDPETAAVLAQVHEEEIAHVRFAVHWLRALSGEEGIWQTYLQTVPWPLGPHRARGRTFDADSRRRAGLDEEFIAGLAGAVDPRSG